MLAPLKVDIHINNQTHPCMYYSCMGLMIVVNFVMYRVLGEVERNGCRYRTKTHIACGWCVFMFCLHFILWSIFRSISRSACRELDSPLLGTYHHTLLATDISIMLQCLVMWILFVCFSSLKCRGPPISWVYGATTKTSKELQWSCVYTSCKYLN